MTNRYVISTNQIVQSRAIGLACLFFLTCAFLASTANAQSESETDSSEALKRVSAAIKYLASDELGGRQPGTPGMVLAEKYIMDEYKKIGLKPINEKDGYVQSFGVGGTRTVNKEQSTLVLHGPDDTTLTLELDEQFKPQMGRSNFDANGPLVFVGYGISAEEHNYDEFADVDVEGKIVVFLRMEPQQNDEDSVFDGLDNSNHAFIRTKTNLARRAGAVGVLMVNDSQSAPNAEQDELPDYEMFGRQRIPFATIKRESFNKVLAKTPIIKGDGTKFPTLDEVEADIDRNLETLSQELKGWSCDFEVEFSEKENLANNLIGIIEGEGPLKDEIIIIGGHHDHLGMGSYGSRSGERAIHNGADDNATGTAGLIELARRFQARDEKPKRTLVFICFSAEEMGLLGATHYCKNPIFPLENTVTMINYDMIGWLREKRLTIFNWNSSAAFGPVLKAANEDHGMDLNLPAAGFAGSDHLPFFQRDVPVMFIHTGLTDTYHTPEDDFDTINCEGVMAVIDYTEDIIDGLVNLEEAPTFADAKQRRDIKNPNEAEPSAPVRIRLGVKWDDDWDDELDEEIGVKVEAVLEDSLAESAGLQEGDIVTEFAGESVKTRRQIVMLTRRKSGEDINIKLLRGEEKLNVDMSLSN